MTKTEALDKIKKLLEESALGGRWSFTDQALALVAEIEADAPPAAPVHPAPARRMQACDVACLLTDRSRCRHAVEHDEVGDCATLDGPCQPCQPVCSPPAPAPASPEPQRVEMRTSVLEELMGLLSDIRQPVVPYSADPLAMAQSAISRMQRDARIAEQSLRAELPQYFGERF